MVSNIWLFDPHHRLIFSSELMTLSWSNRTLSSSSSVSLSDAMQGELSQSTAGSGGHLWCKSHVLLMIQKKNGCLLLCMYSLQGLIDGSVSSHALPSHLASFFVHCSSFSQTLILLHTSVMLHQYGEDGTALGSFFKVSAAKQIWWFSFSSATHQTQLSGISLSSDRGLCCLIHWLKEQIPVTSTGMAKWLPMDLVNS